MSRTTFLWLAVALAVAGPARAQLELPLPVALDPKIEAVLAPLSSMPSIQRADEPFAVETAPGASGAPASVEAWITPSFGAHKTRVSVGTPVEVSAGAASKLWPGRTVDRLLYKLPADLPPDLYDLEVAVAPTSPLGGLQANDHQRRALSIVKEYKKKPRVVVIADPSVGDPRIVQDAALDAIQRGEVQQLITLVQRSIGNPINSERWAALNRVIQEINLVRPDFVLVTGDLTFLVYPQLLPLEFEDAWNLLDRLEVPAYVAPGNHDLYAVDDYLGANTPDLWDGKALWQQYFGPLYFSADVGPDLHLASLNTFEWPVLTPFPPEEEFDTRAAGQVLQEQRDWLDADLRAYRERSPKGVAVTMAHHDPSWMQRRHAWTGEGRLETREILAQNHVGVHFAGHTHEDRVARYYKGDIIETNGRPHVDGHVVKQLHYLLRDGTLDASLTQEQMGAILREPKHGPLFVTTTTAASQMVGDIWGLGGYWGWRVADLDSRDNQGGLDPADFGYPVTDEYLAERAERPENWTAEHAQYGLFSYPSYELDHEQVSDSEMRVTSRLLTDLVVHARLRVPAEEGQPLAIKGGEVLQVRYADGEAEAVVSAVAPAHGEVSLRLEAVEVAADALGKTGRFGGAFAAWLLLAPLLLRRFIRRQV